MKPIIILKYKIETLTQQLNELRTMQLDNKTEYELKINNLVDKIQHYQSILTELEENMEE